MKKFLALLLGAESWQEMKKKGLKLALIVPAVRWIDWVAVGVTGSLVVFLKEYGFSDMSIFLVLWGGNVAYSGIVVFINDTTKTDILLMEALRRMINALIAKSRRWGYVIETVILVRLIVWDGPDNFVLFFRERLATWKQQAIVLVLTAGIQMALWTAVYVAGYQMFF